MNDSRLIAAADEFGTPLYVFDEEPLRERVALLEDVLGPRATLCFAVKANPLAIPLITPYVHRFEVCSPGELRICQNVDVPAGEIVLSGVAKDEALIRGLLDAGAEVHRYTVESRRQFDMLLELAREYARPLPLLLRLTCGSQFGMDEADIRAIIAEHGSDPAVDIWGIQQFSGTQKTSLRRVERELAAADALMEAAEGMSAADARVLRGEDACALLGGLEVGRTRKGCVELPATVLSRALLTVVE